MQLSKLQVQETLQELKAFPIFQGCDTFLLFNEPIDTESIRSTEELIVAAFRAGQNSKTNEIKKVLQIVEYRR